MTEKLMKFAEPICAIQLVLKNFAESDFCS